MKLRYIEGKHIKGKTFCVRLRGAVTVFVGDSFAGKTAILDTVRIALLGYHPKLGIRDTYKISSEPEFEVALGFNDTTEVRRRWWLQKGSWKHEGHEDQIVPPAMLDCREYFGMTGPERMRYVFNQLDLAALGFDAARVLSTVRGLRPEENTEHTEAAIREAVTLANELDNARQEEGATMQEWIEGIVQGFTERRKQATTGVAQFDGLTQGATQLKAESGQAPVRNVEPELKSAREKAATLRAQHKSMSDALASNNKHDERRAWLQSELKRSKNYTEDIRHLERSVCELEKKLAGTLPDVFGAQKTVSDLQSRLSAKESEVNMLNGDLKNMESEHKQRMQLTCCPFCHSERKGWQDGIKKDYLDRVTKHKSLREKTEDDCLRLKGLLGAAEATLEVVRMHAGELRDAQQALNAENRQLNNFKAIDKEFEQYRTELATLEVNRPPSVDGFKLPELEQEIQITEADIARLDGEHRKFIAAKANESTMLRAAEARLKHKAAEEVFKLGIAAVKKLQQEMIDAALRALMGVANKFTTGILKAPLEYRDGDIGYVNDGQWVSHECFSGTEEALAYAGLSVALAQQSTFKLVIIDELGIADTDTKAKMMDRMVALESLGVIDGFLGTDVSAIGLERAGVSVEKIL